METMQEFCSFFVEQVLPHWPGLMFIVVIIVVAQTLKTRVLTRDIAAKYRSVFWLRRVLPLVLLGLGAITGSLWSGEASPGISTTTHKVWYFTGCSGISIIGFNAFKQWVKRKYDVEIGIQSVAPPVSEDSDESSTLG